MDTTPITVHLTSVKPDLTMVWAADGTVWLLPADTFADADGGQYTVIAVTDEYLQLATPKVVPKPPTTDVSVETTPVDSAPVASTPADETPTTARGADNGAVSLDAAAAALVGLSEADAATAAQTNGWELRVSQRDGADLPVTMDYRSNRVNVAVASGAVVAVQSIG